MDGIDGIAGLQAFIAGIGWLAAGILLQTPTIQFFGGILAFSSLGFLFQNWQPAKIFMGDVGSAFLGYTFAVIPVLAAKETGVSIKDLLMTAAALVWLFLFDTIFTFCRRILNFEKVWKPHKTHIYQRLVTHGLSHRLVAGIYGSLTGAICILAFLKLSNSDYQTGLFAAVVSAPLVLLILLKIQKIRNAIKVNLKSRNLRIFS
jgi:UDP-N-acetylmuramyl pentapeptide phosphotransferase/UDP-N-acetylglucosamine-1-phosphate transferase